MTKRKDTAQRRSLTAKQRLFIQLFNMDRDIYAAALRAGYSDRTPKARIRALFATPHIQQAIAEDWQMLVKVTKIARASIADYIDIRPDGSFAFKLDKALEAQREGILTVTSQVRTEHRGDKQVRVETQGIHMADKLGALALLLGRLRNCDWLDRPLSAPAERLNRRLPARRAPDQIKSTI